MKNFWSQIRVLNVMRSKAELNHISQHVKRPARKKAPGRIGFWSGGPVQAAVFYLRIMRRINPEADKCYICRAAFDP